MTTNVEIAVVEQAAAPGVRSRASLRLAPLDALRGLIIVVMALDHANVFIARQHPRGGCFDEGHRILPFT